MEYPLSMLSRDIVTNAIMSRESLNHCTYFDCSILLIWFTKRAYVIMICSACIVVKICSVVSSFVCWICTRTKYYLLLAPAKALSFCFYLAKLPNGLGLSRVSLLFAMTTNIYHATYKTLENVTNCKFSD